MFYQFLPTSNIRNIWKVNSEKNMCVDMTDSVDIMGTHRINI